MDGATYKLDELAERAGVSVRTVRYYLQRGLLPAPPFRGKDTAYGPEHLLRLRAIRVLQDRYYPLDAIAAELARRDAAALERLADGLEPAASPPDCAPPVTAAQHAPVARPLPTGDDGASWRRLALAPGVEVWLADTVDEDTRRTVLATCMQLQQTLRGNAP